MGSRTPGRETLRENIPFLNAFLRNVIFGLQTMFFDGCNVLMSFLAEKMMQNDLEITSKEQLLTQNMQN